MSLHLVHADANGNLAVVAVLLERGADNALIDELWSDVPHEKEREEKLDNVQINAKALLPSDLGYYTFTGSLTTPPARKTLPGLSLSSLLRCPRLKSNSSRNYIGTIRGQQNLFMTE